MNQSFAEQKRGSLSFQTTKLLKNRIYMTAENTLVLFSMASKNWNFFFKFALG